MLPGKPKNHTPHYTTFPMARLIAANEAMLQAAATMKEYRDSVPPSARPLAEAINTVLGMLTNTGMSFSMVIALDEHQREHCTCTSDNPNASEDRKFSGKGFNIEDHLPDALKNRLKNRFDMN